VSYHNIRGRPHSTREIVRFTRPMAILRGPARLSRAFT
jgi:hypothetical protein